MAHHVVQCSSTIMIIIPRHHIQVIGRQLQGLPGSDTTRLGLPIRVARCVWTPRVAKLGSGPYKERLLIRQFRHCRQRRGVSPPRTTAVALSPDALPASAAGTALTAVRHIRAPPRFLPFPPPRGARVGPYPADGRNPTRTTPDPPRGGSDHPPPSGYVTAVGRSYDGTAMGRAGAGGGGGGGSGAGDTGNEERPVRPGAHAGENAPVLSRAPPRHERTRRKGMAVQGGAVRGSG